MFLFLLLNQNMLSPGQLLGLRFAETLFSANLVHHSLHHVRRRLGRHFELNLQKILDLVAPWAVRGQFCTITSHKPICITVSPFGQTSLDLVFLFQHWWWTSIWEWEICFFTPNFILQAQKRSATCGDVLTRNMPRFLITWIRRLFSDGLQVGF